MAKLSAQHSLRPFPGLFFEMGGAEAYVRETTWNCNNLNLTSAKILTMVKLSFPIMVIFILQTTSLFGQSSYFEDGTFFDEVNAIMQAHVKDGAFDYAALAKDPDMFLNIMGRVDQANFDGWKPDTKKAFLINAYNLTVVKSVLLEYPINSTQEIPGFFTEKEHMIAGEMMTLNYLENEIIRPQYNDARVHFALNCGAKGCPEIVNEAYFPSRLDEQLDLCTTKKLNEADFVRFDNDKRKLQLNQIFDWYGKDFGSNKKEIIGFINKYRTEKIPNDYGINFYPYDWVLNGPAGSVELADGDDSYRFLVSSLYEKGEFEINLFNAYFAQQNNLNIEGGETRTGFLSNLVQVLIGITPRFNAGFDIQFRSVSGDRPQSETPYFDAINYANTGNIFSEGGAGLGYTRTGLSRIGPKVKYLPFKNQSNISVQHTLYFPAPNDSPLQGDGTTGWLDWNETVFWTQVLYDRPVGDYFTLFFEADLLLENSGRALTRDDSGFFQVSTPLTFILSYFPIDEITIYGLSGYSPNWFTVVNEPDGGEDVTTYDPFNQFGLGFKYLWNNRYQIELLATDFNHTKRENTSAATFNIGFRYIFKK